MNNLTNIITDLSLKYNFNALEALEYINSRYFQNDYTDILKDKKKEIIIEALKIHAGIDRKKHIFSKMKTWSTEEFIKYIKTNNISSEQLKELLLQSSISLENIEKEKKNKKIKRGNELLEFIQEIKIGDIIDNYLIIEKQNNHAVCLSFLYKKYDIENKNINIHLGCSFNNNSIENKTYAFLRNKEPYIKKQAEYNLRFNVGVKNIHNYVKNFFVGNINEDEKRDSNILNNFIINIKYPTPEEYPSDFNEIPKFGFSDFNNNNDIDNVNNVNIWCDTLELDYKYKNDVEKIKKQYKIMALKLHPDKNTEDTTELFQNLNNAYAGLMKINEK